MQNILVGLLVLAALGVVVAAATHWLVGLAIIVVPITVVYARLKLSPVYRAATDVTMSQMLAD